MKKYAAVLLALLVSCLPFAGCTQSDVDTDTQSVTQSVSQAESDSVQEVSSAVSEVSDDKEYFSNSDLRSVDSEEPNAAITLSGSEGTISDTTRGTSGSEVEIHSRVYTK